MSHRKLLNGTGKYTPSDAVSAALYGLHRDFTFESFETMPTEKFPIVYYRFKRLDGTYINYFGSIRDKALDTPDNCFPTLDEFLAAYQNRIDSKLISDTDITIVPFLQVQKRRHFNTLVLHAAENKLHAHIVEPRSSNFTLPPNIYYPISESIDKIRNFFSVKNRAVVVHNPTIGKQAIYDDITCGLHHVNFTEIIAHLKSETIAHANRFKRVLGRANIFRRYDDKDKIDSIFEALKKKATVKAQDKNGEGEKEEILADPSKDKEKVLKPLQDTIEEKDEYDEFMDETGDDVDRDASSYEDESSFNSSEAQQTLSKKIKKIEAKRAELALEDAVSLIETDYTVPATARTGFFSRSTRLETAGMIANLLDKIQRDNNADQKTKIYYSALTLHFFHFAIGPTKSELRNNIEKAMAKLLNCESEYNHILETSSDKARFNKANALFRLHLCAQGRSTQDEMDLYRYVKKMNAIDSSWLYKFGSTSYREKRDEKRNELFEMLKAGILNDLSQPPRFNYVL